MGETYVDGAFDWTTGALALHCVLLDATREKSMLDARRPGCRSGRDRWKTVGKIAKWVSMRTLEIRSICEFSEAKMKREEHVP